MPDLLRRIRVKIFACFQVLCFALARKFRRSIGCRPIVYDLCDIFELGVGEGKLPDAALQVGRVERERVEAGGMGDGFAMRLVLGVPRELGLLGVLEALELRL